jgi:hypothetical protein
MGLTGTCCLRLFSTKCLMTKVAVYGFGKVGRHLVEALTKAEGVQVKYVVTKTQRLTQINEKTIMTTEVDIPILDPEVEFIFECITDDSVAEYVVNRSLDKLKTVISCNKSMWHSRWQNIKGSPELVLLNSLACNEEGRTAYPDINITLSNVHELNPDDLYKFRGCDGRCAASVMVQDFIAALG